MNSTTYIFLLTSFSLLAIASGSALVQLIVLTLAVLSSFVFVLMDIMNHEDMANTYYPNNH